MAALKQVTPMIWVKDLNVSLDFYTRVLGFSVGLLMDGVYAYMTWGPVAFRLLQDGAGEGEKPSDHTGQLSCYVDVAGLDDLYAELKPALDPLPPGRVRAPFNQDYGQREFHVIDPDGFLIFFGEAIKAG